MKLIAKDCVPTLYHNGAVSITFDCDINAKESILAMKRGDYVLDITKPKDRRTLSQNALLWELIGLIDVAENGSRANDLEIYVNILKMAGARVESISIRKDAIEEFKQRTSDVFREYVIVSEWKNSKGTDFVMLNCFYGSSKLSTQEMTSVIDVAISYAESVGVSVKYYKQEREK